MSKKRQNNTRGKRFLLGVVGSLGGLLAMRVYWQYVAPIVKTQFGSHMRDQITPSPHSSERLNDISLVGQQHRADETATEALGRILSERITGHEPTSISLLIF